MCAAYAPPTEDLPIFNPAVFFVDETGITLGEADARYLKLSGGILTGNLATPSITLNGSNLETDITNLENKTQDLTFSGNTSTFDGNIEATGNIYVSGNNKFIGVDNGTSSIKIQNHANHADFEVINPDNAIHFKSGGVELFELKNTETLFYKPLKANTSVDIGDGTTRFNTIYASTINLPTISDVASQITTNTSNITTLQTKTTQLSYDSGTTTTTFGGSTLDVNSTLALPLHANVDSTLTTIEGNITTLQSDVEPIQSWTYDNVNNITNANNRLYINGNQLVIVKAGDSVNGIETNTHNALRITTGTNERSIWMGYDNDNTRNLGYINCAESGSIRPLGLQVRGGNVAIGKTNPSEVLDVNGTIKGNNLKTTNHNDIDGLLTNLESNLSQITYVEPIQETTIDGMMLTIPRNLNIGTDNGTDGATIYMEGIAGDVGFNHSVIETRRYDNTNDNSEMLFFKGNDSAHDRIRMRAGQIMFDCYTGNTTDRIAENIIASMNSSGLNILTNPIKASTYNDGVNNWAMRVPVQLSLIKTIPYTTTTSIRLPKNIGNFSGGPNYCMVYLINISRTDGDWNNSNRASYLGLLQISIFSIKKARLYTLGANYQFSVLTLVEVGDEIELLLQASTTNNITCTITLTQIR